MQNLILTGMVIKSSEVGESDKRLVILTRERGKIVAFARGARRPKSPLLAVTRLFVYGSFTLFEGKDAYTLAAAEIENYFSKMSEDMETMCYGCYLLELADYFSRENMESTQLLKLLYQSLRAVMNERLPNRLVKCIFELKSFVIHGEYPQVFECVSCGSQDIVFFSPSRLGMFCEQCGMLAPDRIRVNISTVYTLQFVISSPVEKLYTFLLKEEVLKEFEMVMERLRKKIIDREFRSLAILDTF